MSFKKEKGSVLGADSESATKTELESIVSELLTLDDRHKADEKRIKKLKDTLKKDYPGEPWVDFSRREGFRAGTHERSPGFDYAEFAKDHPALSDKLVLATTTYELDKDECNALAETYPELISILQKYMLPGTMVTQTRRFKLDEEEALEDE